MAAAAKAAMKRVRNAPSDGEMEGGAGACNGLHDHWRGRTMTKN
jgi:hypothetical protein